MGTAHTNLKNTILHNVRSANPDTAIGAMFAIGAMLEIGRTKCQSPGMI